MLISFNRIKRPGQVIYFCHPEWVQVMEYGAAMHKSMYADSQQASKQWSYFWADAAFSLLLFFDRRFEVKDGRRRSWI